MLAYVKAFMQELGFETEAIESLSADLSRICACEEARAELCEAVSDYEADFNVKFSLLLDKAAKAGALAGVHRYSAHMLLCLLLSRPLRERYRNEGISDEIFVETMSDLKWKLWECKIVEGVYGTFVGFWYGIFFSMRLFAFGRLQFEIRKFRRSYEKDGKRLTPESLVLGVHIPRMPTPFRPEYCDDSFARAKIFFADRLGDAPMAFVCNSWILYPEHERFLHENSNVRKFMSRFDIIEQKVLEEDDVYWRIFDTAFTGDVEALPEDSFLRKAYKSHLRAGGKMGSGFGVFFAE